MSVKINCLDLIFLCRESSNLWLQVYARLGIKSRSRDLILQVIQTSKNWFKSRLEIETRVWGLKTPNQTYT
jgi:hypothetical protein